MKIIFLGRKKYAAQALKWTIEMGVDVLCVCTDSRNFDFSTKEMADKLGIPVVSIEEAEKYAMEYQNEIDLVVSYLYWRKIKRPLIDMPKFGCINFHPAILPDWRGTAGYNIAILNKLSEWGATAHYVDENIDTGDIIRVFRFNFDYRLETAFSLERKTQDIQFELYKSVLCDAMEKGKLPCHRQDTNSGVYISKDEMLNMMHVDIGTINKDELDLKIRAFWFPPYHGAGITIDGKFYTLVNDEILQTLLQTEEI